MHFQSRLKRHLCRRSYTCYNEFGLVITSNSAPARQLTRRSAHVESESFESKTCSLHLTSSTQHSHTYVLTHCRSSNIWSCAPSHDTRVNKRNYQIILSPLAPHHTTTHSTQHPKLPPQNQLITFDQNTLRLPAPKHGTPVVSRRRPRPPPRPRPSHGTQRSVQASVHRCSRNPERSLDSQRHHVRINFHSNTSLAREVANDFTASTTTRSSVCSRPATWVQAPTLPRPSRAPPSAKHRCPRLLLPLLRLLLLLRKVVGRRRLRRKLPVRRLLRRVATTMKVARTTRTTRSPLPRRRRRRRVPSPKKRIEKW